MGHDYSPKYMIHLDGVRAVAAGMVVYSHFFPSSPVHDAVNWGYVGVRLFFVLSGFLITGILLDARERAAGGNVIGVLRNFYLRRILRIFPIYYMALLGGAAVANATHKLRDPMEFASYLTYTTNWLLCWYPSADLIAGHYWSLAVEEQFYLVWPWLMLFVPRRWLLPSILAAIGLAPAVRFALVLQGYSVVAISFNTPGCLDTLGGGALLALLQRNPWREGAGKMLAWCGLFVAVPLVFLTVPTQAWPTHYFVVLTLQDVFWGCLFVWVIWCAANGFPGTIGRIMEAGPIVYLGKISYGIYAYHGIAGEVVPWLFGKVGLLYPDPGYSRAILLTVLSVVVASFSWHVFEAPINACKRYFPYQNSRVLLGMGPVPKVVKRARNLLAPP